jgi:hypothetical protein
MLTPYDILTSGDKYADRIDSPECTTQVRICAADTAERVSKLLTFLGFTGVKVSSGFRTQKANTDTKGAKDSAHLYGMAVDIIDKGGLLAKAIMANTELLRKFDLYIENPQQTPTWIHFQTRKPYSGNRIFWK